MSGFFWIASYPRSGNTWLRFLLTSLLRGPVQHSDEVAAFVQDVHLHRTVTPPAAGLKLLKTHWRYHAQFPLTAETLGAVYLVRHPAAVLESSLNFYFLQKGAPADDAARDELARSWVSDFIGRGGSRAWIDGRVGTWAENVDSWTSDDVPFPRVTIRYEDLRADPASRLRLVCQALGVARTEADIERAIADVSIERMAAMEEAELATGRVGFFNNEALRGRACGFRQVRSDDRTRMKITGDEHRRVVAASKALCDHWGYTAAS